MIDASIGDEGKVFREVDFDDAERGGDCPHQAEGLIIDVWIFQVEDFNIKDGFVVDAVLELRLVGDGEDLFLGHIFCFGRDSVVFYHSYFQIYIHGRQTIIFSPNINIISNLKNSQNSPSQSSGWTTF